jgi:phage host-nuclease inhibitor protein Gam
MATKAKRTNRIKAPELPVPATLAEAEALLLRMGGRQREVAAIEGRMNERLAAVKAEFEQIAAPITEQIEADFQALQAWAEAHRATLLERERKSAKLATGELGWRTSPPSVRISGLAAVIAAFKQLGLDRFIRTKEEIDKQAIQKEPEAVEHVKGVSITQQEEFWIRPFESEIERTRSRKVE